MDTSLVRLRAAHAADIDALYATIQDDADVFQRIDQMKFVDTPLHIAVAARHYDFAMEIMNINPSFAKKLNQQGLSPIHLALQNNNTVMVVDLIAIDKDLVCIKGREGYTPLHIVSRDGNVPLLSNILNYCPNSIGDLTIRKETTLHIAARNNRLEAFKAILQWIQRNLDGDLIKEVTILNWQDKDGNTALHIAASDNQPQMIKLLTKCKGVDRNIINRRGLTALDILQQQTQVIDIRESVDILYHAECSSLRFLKLSRFFTGLIVDIDGMEPETINALLVVFALVLTMTYQALLSPPGGVFQGDASSSESNNVGKSVLEPFQFLWFYIPNGIAFVTAWLITIFLLRIVAKRIMPFLYPLYFLMCFCYGAALSTISPTRLSSWVGILAPTISVLFIYYMALLRFKKQQK